MKKKTEKPAVMFPRYTFSVCHEIELGKPCQFEMAGHPNVEIIGDRFLINSPCPGFVYIDSIQVGGLSIIVGGSEDAHNFSPTSYNVKLDFPRCSTSTRFTVKGRYTGLVPPHWTEYAPELLLEWKGFKLWNPFTKKRKLSKMTLCATMQGPARVVA